MIEGATPHAGIAARRGTACAARPRCSRRIDIPLGPGEWIRCRTVATLERVDGPVKVDRENASRYAVVQANVSGRDLVGFVDEAKASRGSEGEAARGLPHDLGRPVREPAAGRRPARSGGAGRAGPHLPAAVRDVRLGAAGARWCSRNIPFAMVGGIVALWASGEYLSVPASVGFIALLGIAVLNGVVMMTYFNQLRAQGMPLDQVVHARARSAGCARCS